MADDDKTSDSGHRKTSIYSQHSSSMYSAETSLNTLQNDNDVVLSTEPKILFCDLGLLPGDTKSCKNKFNLFIWTIIVTLIAFAVHTDLFKEILPLYGPSTYRGKSIRYFYKITIATQKVGSKVQVLRLPIRVLSLPTSIRPDEIPTLCNDTSDELSPSNPFLESRKSAETKLEIALHHLQNTTARRRPNFYLILNKRGRVGRFCLFKQNFKLGEDIVGTLDFTCRSVRCVQVSVTLQCEEIFVKQPLTGTDGKPQNSTLPPTEAENARIMNFTKHHEVCLGLLQTQMILPVPLHVTPSFQTPKGI